MIVLSSSSFIPQHEQKKVKCEGRSEMKSMKEGKRKDGWKCRMEGMKEGMKEV
jgi:hypothetical protein